MFVHEGDHVLFSIHARFVDPDKLSTNSSFEDLNKYNYQLGDFPPNVGSTIDPAIPFNDTHKQDFNIFFNARNGFWEQLIRLRFVNGQWLTATRVTRNLRKDKVKQLYERIDKDFSRNSRGGVDW
jgi:hypothetical protein